MENSALRSSGRMAKCAGRNLKSKFQWLGNAVHTSQAKQSGLLVVVWVLVGGFDFFSDTV